MPEEAPHGGADAATSQSAEVTLVPSAGRLRWLVVAALLGIAAVARLVLFVGIRRLDMYRYMELSNHVLSGGGLFDEGVFYAARRLALMLPLIASNALGGYGELVSVAWPLLCSLGSVLVVYLLAEELWGWKVGALAGLGMAFYPLEIELGTQLLPDPIAGFFIALAVYLAVLAVRRDRHERWYAIGSGAALGSAFFARENVLVFLPGLMLVGILLDPPKWRRTMWVPVGIVLVAALGAVFFWVFYGNPVIDWIRFREFYAAYQDAGFVEPKAIYVAEFLMQPAFEGFLTICVLALLGLVLDRSRGRWVLLVWAVGFWAFLDLVGPLIGMDVSYRYAEPIMPPLIVLAAVGVSALGKRVKAENAVIVGAALALLLLLPSAREATTNWTRNQRWRSIEDAWQAVSERPSAVIFTDDSLVFVALNYDARYTLGRDTLASADAEVNEGSRLFKLGEIPLSVVSGGAPVFLVLSGGLPEGLAADVELVRPYGRSGTLRVYQLK